jgi:predicted nucleic acid-binding Zn ribbon protein
MFCPKCGKELPDDSQFCSKCGQSTTGAASVPKPKSRVSASRILGGITVGILLAIAIVFFMIRMGGTSVSNPSSPPPVAFLSPAPVLLPATQNLFTGQITVRPGGYVSNTFTVQPGMLNFHVVGQFSASGGLGNDIQVVLADPNQFQDWINGHPATVFYSTNKETTEHFDIGPLGQGQYIFAFSNKFSIFAQKQVFTQVDANWQTRR